MNYARRMFFLQYGAERVSKGLSLAGGPHEMYWEPLMGALVETQTGWVLLDTGMSRAAHESPAITDAYRAGDSNDTTTAVPWHVSPVPPDQNGWNWILPGNPLETALAEHGLRASDLTVAAVSHLHVDHSGGIPTLARAGVPIAIQGRELAFAKGGSVGAAEGFHEPDWTEPGTAWQELDGDCELAPGVNAIFTPGHTTGHMSFRVDLEQSGSWVLTGDATDLGQNLLDRVPCGSCAGGAPEDERNAVESLERLLEIGKTSNVRLVPGHDQIIANVARHPRGGHQ